jgi:hypothetical protein
LRESPPDVGRQGEEQEQGGKGGDPLPDVGDGLGLQGMTGKEQGGEEGDVWCIVFEGGGTEKGGQC